MSNAGHVSGKVAVVTGGAHGMGAAHVRALAREGAIVAATDIIDDLGALCVPRISSAALTSRVALPAVRP
jgi:3alpha(or 20beta)-hydroxysteroid dehydrogenase